MARFKLEDGAIVDTDGAAQSWDEGRYYIVHSSQWQGSRDHAEEIPARDAAAWLLQNDHELPEDLAEYEGDVIE